MSERYNFPSRAKGDSKAGVTIHLNLLDDTEPLDITLFFKRPKQGGDEQASIDETSFTACGKLIFKFGERGYVELFAENTKLVNEASPIQTEGE